MWKSLIWKEWHEQRWRLVFGCCVLLSMTFVGLHTRLAEDEGIIGLVTVVGAVLLPALHATSLISPEREERSWTTLVTLPLPARCVFLIKTAVGAAVVAAPFLASGVIALLVAGGREMASSKIAALFAMSAGSAVMMFIWCTAVGARKANEAHSILAAIGAMGVWGLAMMAAVMVVQTPLNWVLYSSPLGLLALNGPSDSKPVIVLVQLAIGAGLWVWGAAQFSQPVKSRG